MFSYMDYPPFYIVYLCVLALNLALCALYYFYHSNNERISILQPILRILLISTIVIWLLDSIPYLYLPMEEFSGANIILSNLFAAIIAATAILYQIPVSRNIQHRTVKNIKNQPNKKSRYK